MPSILPILTLPDTRLRQVSRPVADGEFGPDLDVRIADLFATMQASKGVGLAAVQVGDLRRIIVCVLDGEDVTMVNPVIAKRSKITHEDTEGCLSIPGRVVRRTRARQITVEYRTPSGTQASRILTGFSARVVQHECDHLDGKTL